MLIPLVLLVAARAMVPQTHEISFLPQTRTHEIPSGIMELPEGVALCDIAEALAPVEHELRPAATSSTPPVEVLVGMNDATLHASHASACEAWSVEEGSPFRSTPLVQPAATSAAAAPLIMCGGSPVYDLTFAPRAEVEEFFDAGLQRIWKSSGTLQAAYGRFDDFRAFVFAARTRGLQEFSSEEAEDKWNDLRRAARRLRRNMEEAVAVDHDAPAAAEAALLAATGEGEMADLQSQGRKVLGEEGAKEESGDGGKRMPQGLFGVPFFEKRPTKRRSWETDEALNARIMEENPWKRVLRKIRGSDHEGEQREDRDVVDLADDEVVRIRVFHFLKGSELDKAMYDFLGGEAELGSEAGVAASLSRARALPCDPSPVQEQAEQGHLPRNGQHEKVTEKMVLDEKNLLGRNAGCIGWAMAGASDAWNFFTVHVVEVTGRALKFGPFGKSEDFEVLSESAGFTGHLRTGGGAANEGGYYWMGFPSRRRRNTAPVPGHLEGGEGGRPVPSSTFRSTDLLRTAGWRPVARVGGLYRADSLQNALGAEFQGMLRPAQLAAPGAWASFQDRVGLVRPVVGLKPAIAPQEFAGSLVEDEDDVFGDGGAKRLAVREHNTKLNEIFEDLLQL